MQFGGGAGGRLVGGFQVLAEPGLRRRYRITVHRSYFRGWKVSPSHYLNQQLDNVWLDPSMR